MRIGISLTLLVLIANSGSAQIEQNFKAFFDTTETTPGTIKLTLTEEFGVANEVLSVEVDNLASYIGRPKIDARTGGATADQDVGDISIKYFTGNDSTSVVYAADPASAMGPDVLSNNTLPDGVDGGLTRVAYADEFDTAASMGWSTEYSDDWERMEITFPIRFGIGFPENDLADGIGFSYVRESIHGSSGAFYSSGEEPAASGFGIGFDIWDNGGEGPSSVSAHFNGVLLESVNLMDPELGFEFDSVSQGLTALESGAPITATIEVIASEQTADPPTLIGGSTFTAAATRSFPVGGLTPAQDGDDGGTIDAFYRLTDSVNDQGNYIAFDQVANAGSRPVFGARTGGANERADIDSVRVDYGPSSVDASFDFRLTDGTGPADGLSFTLARTETHGTSGEVSQRVDKSAETGVDWDVAEDPRLAGSLGVGLKTFEDNELRIRYDGEDIANISSAVVGFPEGFADGEWHTIDVSVEDEGEDALVSIFLDDSEVFSSLISGAAGLGLPEWRFIPNPSGAPRDWFSSTAWEIGTPPTSTSTVVFDHGTAVMHEVRNISQQTATADKLRVTGSNIRFVGDFDVNEATVTESSTMRTSGVFDADSVVVESSTFIQQSGFVTTPRLSVTDGLYDLQRGVLDLMQGRLTVSGSFADQFAIGSEGELRNVSIIDSSFEFSDGVFAPGAGATVFATTSIDGSYTQKSQAILDIDLSGPNSDSVRVGGTAFLDGQLRVDLHANPKAGDRYTIVESLDDLIVGNFSILTLDRNTDLAAQLIVSSDKVELEFVTPTVQQNVASGTFHDIGIWAAGFVPNSKDDAVISNDVVLSAPAIVHDVVLRGPSSSLSGLPGVDFSSTGEVVVEKGTELTSEGESWTLYTSRVTVHGVLSGNIVVDGDIFIDDGLITPGNSSGVITSTGDLTHGDASETEIEVSEDSSDRIDVEGTAFLDGSLDVVLSDGYQGPDTVGEVDRHPFLSAGDVEGSYDIGSGFVDDAIFFDTVETSTGMDIAIRRTLHGDANGDGKINSEDLNVVAVNWQQAGNWEMGDFTGDGFVDSEDLNVIGVGWQQTVAAASVPEPQGLPMFVGILLLFSLKRRHRRVSEYSAVKLRRKHS